MAESRWTMTDVEFKRELRSEYERGRRELLREIVALCHEQGITLRQALDEYEASRG